ncbi:TatD family hydrolase [Bacteroidota bacterium]
MATIFYIDIHSHNKEEEKGIIRFINLFPDQINRFIKTGEHYYSLGIHPWYVKEYSLEEDIELIKNYCENKNYRAIGEIGLDRITDFPLDKQTDIFLMQLKIAEMIKKPVIIHCVKAFPELLSIKKTRESQIPWIIHGYNNNIQIAQDLLSHNCYISFGYHLLVDNSNAQKIFEKIPVNMFLLETDDKQVTIQDVYKKAAEIKKMDIQKLKKIVIYNYRNIFGE